MKICIALHQCMDLGGIINHTEQLIGGLKDLGHDVALREMVWSANAYDKKMSGNFVLGPSGIPHDQGKGWQFKRGHRIPYKGSAKLQAARLMLSEFDLIIWTVPVPTKAKSNLGNSDWPALYDPISPRTMQVAFVHDGNAKRNSGHIVAIQEHLSGICCVHPCSLGGADFVGVPRQLVLNPQFTPAGRAWNTWDQKLPGFIACQTFKAWKRVHELVGAVRFMDGRKTMEMRDIAGRGIEYQYLTSEDKCKDAYYHADGERFWEAALANGMLYHDYWTSNEVDARMHQSRLFVDPSWSKNYSKVGAHFNRTGVEAMMHGTILVAREMGMGSDLFLPGEHYIAIEQDADLAEYATVLTEAGHMPAKYAKRFRDNCEELMPLFDRERIAQQVVDIAYGVEVMLAPGTMTQAHLSKVEDTLFDHYGVII